PAAGSSSPPLPSAAAGPSPPLFPSLLRRCCQLRPLVRPHPTPLRRRWPGTAPLPSATGAADSGRRSVPAPSPPLAWRSGAGGIEEAELRGATYPKSAAARNSVDFTEFRRAGRSSGNLATNSIPNPAPGAETSGREDYTVGDKDAVVIVDHGSRRQESNLMLNDFVEMFRARTGYKIIEPAHMELDESVKRDLKEWNISKELAIDRSAWRLAINVPEP
ncbi:unnamed protein product, partial [Urochloa humidicola]